MPGTSRLTRYTDWSGRSWTVSVERKRGSPRFFLLQTLSFYRKYLSHMTTESPGAQRTVTTRPWVALMALCVGFFMILVDMTIVAVAQPQIMESLGTDVNGVVWVTSAYLLTYAVPLLVTGRLKDVIIRNGENISAREVEDILAGHPGIAEIAVVGVPDARTGERACAVIVPAGGTGPDVAELRAMLSAHGVAVFKAPEQVEIWDALPKNDAGKVIKQQIRAALIGG